MITRPALLCLMTISFLFFIFAWYDTVHAHAFTFTLNEHIYEWLRVPQYYEIWFVITMLGHESVFVLMTGFLLLHLFRNKQTKAFTYCLVTVVIVCALTMLFKHIAHTPRPMPFHAELDSFPSGHTTRATLWCGIFLFAAHIRAIRLPHYVKYLLVIIPILVALSRLGLGRHWLSDVVGAYGFTTGCLALMFATQAETLPASSQQAHSSSADNQVAHSHRGDNPHLESKALNNHDKLE